MSRINKIATEVVIAVTPVTDSREKRAVNTTMARAVIAKYISAAELVEWLKKNQQYEDTYFAYCRCCGGHAPQIGLETTKLTDLIQQFLNGGE